VTLIECYSTLIHGAQDSGKQDLFVAHTEKIFQFLQKSCETQYNPDLELIKLVVSLIGDLANILNKHIAHLIKNPFVEQIIMHLKNQPDQTSQELSAWAIEACKQAI
jgi:hypothetical protein